ncbi:MAG: hypothetical protein ABJB47_13905, partial [Actinomycetota bacterium]
VGRTVCAVAALRGQPGLRRNFVRILIWSTAAGVAWVACGLATGTARGVALAGGRRGRLRRARRRVRGAWPGPLPDQ